MRRLMTEEYLVGRVVGFSVPYRLDPSAVEPGDPLDATRTVWGRVDRASMFGLNEAEPAGYDVTCIHTGEFYPVSTRDIHTVMPRRY